MSQRFLHGSSVSVNSFHLLGRHHDALRVAPRTQGTKLSATDQLLTLESTGDRHLLSIYNELTGD